MVLLRNLFMFCALTFLMISCLQLIPPVQAIGTHTLKVVYYRAYIYNDRDAVGAGEWHFRLGAAGQPWTDYYGRSVDGPGWVDIWFVNKEWPISSSTQFYCQAREEDGLTGATYWGYTSALTVTVPYPWPSVNVWHYGNYKQGDVWHFYKYLIENLAPTASAISGPSAGSPSVAYTYSTTGSDPEGDGVTYEWSVNGVIVPKLMGPSLVYTFPTIGTYTVRVRAKDSFGAFSGYRSKTVTITAPSTATITVTSPNGGESWVRGTTHPITWTWTGSVGANVKIELLKSGVVKGTVTTANDGSYSWTIGTSHLGTDYKIRITSTSNPAITDSSDNNFAITT